MHTTQEKFQRDMVLHDAMKVLVEEIIYKSERMHCKRYPILDFFLIIRLKFVNYKNKLL